MWLAALIMPRLEGVSATTTVWPMRRNPRPRAELRMLASWPARLLVNVTLTVLFLGHDPYPASSATLLPRLAAMSSGVRSFASASIVARTTLIGLREP